MDFLEAHKTLSSFKGGADLAFVMAMSGTASQLKIFLSAAAAKHNRSAVVRTLPFGTLSQILFSDPTSDDPEIFLLLPWDFVPEADWRSGVPNSDLMSYQVLEQAEKITARLQCRPNGRFFFLPAPIPPLLSDPARDAELLHRITALACSLGASLVPTEAFSLGSYLLSGCPITGAWMGRLADQIIESLVSRRLDPCKVLVTDLDDTLWRGVVAEDGLDGIQFSPEGLGFRHFLYQTLLRRLRGEGILLTAVSRNDPDIALAPMRSGDMVLSEGDFVCVLASYHPKSSQVRQIANRLNLDLASFVFVDDNAVELSEVSAQLPQINCLSFPSHDDGLPAFFSRLSRFFPISGVTAEDRERTELYRRRLAGIAPSDLQGADVTDFLSGLQMKLVVHDRTHGDHARAVQLINKTNQFNLNGRRMQNEDIAAALRAGASLYTASLEDRTGSHGEIISCVLMPDGTIESWVMSCRVFQRRLEYAFLAWLAATENPPRTLRFSPTERNLPLQQFLQDPAFERTADGVVLLNARGFADAHAADLSLFNIEAPQARK